MNYASSPGYLLGFHGCDRSIGERALSGRQPLVSSENAYDWLGHGIFFWEGDPRRAEEWVSERMSRSNSGIQEPFVVGAIIEPGYSLSLMQREHLALVETAYLELKEFSDHSDSPLPENFGGIDRFKRYLDCAVIQTVHTQRQRSNLRPFDSVRGLFQEGHEPYPNAGFRMKNHVQICVCNPECIKGYFRPIKQHEL